MTEQKEKKVDEIKKEAEAKKCPVQRALCYMEGFLAGPMCGKCFPCEMGVYEAKIRLQNIAEGRGSEGDVFALRRIGLDMLETSRCKRGKDSAKFLLEWMETDVFKAHVDGKCQDKECLALIDYVIIPENCIMCGECRDVCRYNAIIGEKKKYYIGGCLPFEIRPKRCVKCGECIKVCLYGAIEIVEVKERLVVSG